MKTATRIGAFLGAWIVAEILAFTLVVDALGLFAAIALGLATSALGLADLRRLVAFLPLRERLRAGAGGDPAGLEGALSLIGSALLIVPGFASDLVGLALKSPSVRAGLAARIRNRNRSTRDPKLIDLAPTEWRVLPGKRRTVKHGARTPPCS